VAADLIDNSLERASSPETQEAAPKRMGAASCIQRQQQHQSAPLSIIHSQLSISFQLARLAQTHGDATRY
jgi:hypothetical protein